MRVAMSGLRLEFVSIVKVGSSSRIPLNGSRNPELVGKIISTDSLLTMARARVRTSLGLFQVATLMTDVSSGSKQSEYWPRKPGRFSVIVPAPKMSMFGLKVKLIRAVPSAFTSLKDNFGVASIEPMEGDRVIEVGGTGP